MPQITVKVVPRAKRNQVVEEAGLLKVYVTAPPSDGKANEAVLNLLSDYLGVKKRDLSILHGATARTKVIGIHTL